MELRHSVLCLTRHVQSMFEDLQCVARALAAQVWAGLTAEEADMFLRVVLLNAGLAGSVFSGDDLCLSALSPE